MNIVLANTTYEIAINDRKYILTLPANAPMGEAYDVVYKFMSLIANNIEQTTKAVKREEVKEEAVVKEEVKGN